MKNVTLAAIVVAIAALTGCSSTPPTRAEASAKLVEKVAPEWFMEVPKTGAAFKAVGDGASGSISGAISNARANAFEGICQAAGGTVRSQTKIFRQDTESNSQSMSTTAIRNFCPDVDVSGAVVEKQSVVRDGERFHAFVLVSLDKGAINAKTTKTNATSEFADLDKVNAEAKKN